MTRKKLRKLAKTAKYLELDRNPVALKEALKDMHNPVARRQLTARTLRK